MNNQIAHVIITMNGSGEAVYLNGELIASVNPDHESAEFLRMVYCNLADYYQVDVKTIEYEAEDRWSWEGVVAELVKEGLLQTKSSADGYELQDITIPLCEDTIDLRASLILFLDNEGDELEPDWVIKNELKGRYPTMIGFDDTPIKQSILCLDQNNKPILCSSAMSPQDIIIEYI